MTIDEKQLPSLYGLIVRGPQPSKPTKDDRRIWAKQFRWSLAAGRELAIEKAHVEQLIMLESRGVTVPQGRWLALYDPFTADPRLFKLAGSKARSDKVLLVIQVTAALALDLAVSENGLPLAVSAKKVARELRQAGLLKPGDRELGYSHHAIIKWRNRYKQGSKLYEEGLKIFRCQNLVWTEVLSIACTETRLRAELYKLHEDDPTGSKTRQEFERFIRERREEHERVQQEYFFGTPR